MELRRITLWRYFSQKTGTDSAGNQHIRIKVRALSPTRRKIVDHLSAWLAWVCTGFLALLIIPPVLTEVMPLTSLLIIPIGGGTSYILLMSFFILSIRKGKVIIIDGDYVRTQRYIFFWAYLDRARHVTFTERSFSPLSNKKLKEELIYEAHQTDASHKPSKAYYRHSKMLIIEHQGIPYHLMSIYDVVLAEQIRCQLQAALNEIPVGGLHKITARPSDVWGNQAGDLTNYP